MEATIGSSQLFLQKANKQAEKQSIMQWESAVKQTVFPNVPGGNNAVTTMEMTYVCGYGGGQDRLWAGEEGRNKTRE